MVKKPSRVDPAVKVTKLCASVIPISPTHWPMVNRIVSVRLENRSPSGSSSRMPSASASWLSAGTSPISACPTPK